MGCLILLWTSLLVTWSLYEMQRIFRLHFISMACTLLCSSAVRVHVLHAYRNIDTTSDRISLILDRRVMFLSFHIGFSLVIDAVVWAILEMISGLDPSSVITEPRYLNLDTVSNLCPFIHCDLLVDAIGVVGH